LGTSDWAERAATSMSQKPSGVEACPGSLAPIPITATAIAAGVEEAESLVQGIKQE